MKVWDLHCDTLSELRYAENEGRELSFKKNDVLHIDLERLKQGDYLMQCFACYVNMKKRNDHSLQSCLEMVDIFYRLLEENPDDLMQIKTPDDIRSLSGSGKIGAMLTIEEGDVCMNDVRMLRNLYRLGARMMTLTWNYQNGLAAPNVVPGTAGDVWPCAPVTDQGLTEKGIEFLEEMERLHMVLDVSHLSDGGFWDIIKYGRKPFVASHSDARALCGHVRNLTDDMIRAMAERGGLIGLNYYAEFLDGNPDRSMVKSTIADMIRHAQHIIDIGGSDILALGSDFDGIDGELELTGAQDMPKLAEGMLAAGMSNELVEKIFYKNAMQFYIDNL